MITHGKRYGKCADRIEITLRPVVSLAVQLLVLELCCTLLACLLVLLAVGLLASHATVFDQATGRASLELDGVTCSRPAVGAGFVDITSSRPHFEIDACDCTKTVSDW